MLTGVLDLPWWGYIVVALCFTHLTIVAVTIYLHRHQAHRALEHHPERLVFYVTGAPENLLGFDVPLLELAAFRYGVNIGSWMSGTGKGSQSPDRSVF